MSNHTTPAKQAASGNSITITSPHGQHSMTFLPARGGIASSLIIKQQERLFLHDFFEEESWHDLPGGWPFCFPILARQACNDEFGSYQVDGETYKLPIHGFAWWQPWQVIESGAHHVHMRLCDNATTRDIYPFKFEVELHYLLEDSGLSCRQIYRNTGQRPLPYTSGFHPYFKTPWPASEKAKVTLDYQPSSTLLYNAAMTAVIGENAALRMPSSICDTKINEQLTRVGANHQATLQFPDGQQLSISVTSQKHPDMFGYIQLYTMLDKNFFCLEPWNGEPNAMNSGKGLRQIKPGHSEEALLVLQFN